MPYDVNDPRARLQPTSAAVRGVPRPATYRELGSATPDEQSPNGGQTWWTRSQAVVVGFSDMRPGDTFERSAGQTDEHVLLVLHESTHLRIDHACGSISVTEPAVVVIPPGASIITATTGGTVVRLFAAATCPDLAASCANTADYAEPDPNVADWSAWPGSPGEPQIRVYPIAAYPLVAGRLGRIFRCSTLMVNVFGSTEPARNATALSPHHHDDFEQISLQIAGDYVHHMRTPWTPDSSTWRDDEHRATLSPAIVVIPPPLIHTSQGVGNMNHWLIDVFAPPRVDFSKQSGWVLNADDYPMP